MHISVSEMNRATLVEVTGRVDSTNATKLGDALNERIDAGQYFLVLDLSNIEYMSSAGLREMVAAAKRVRRENGDLRIASPSSRVEEVMKLSGLDMIFKMYPTPVEAVGSF